jgi:hypothetical protein
LQGVLESVAVTDEAEVESAFVHFIQVAYFSPEEHLAVSEYGDVFAGGFHIGKDMSGKENRYAGVNNERTDE